VLRILSRFILQLDFAHSSRRLKPHADRRRSSSHRPLSIFDAVFPPLVQRMIEKSAKRSGDFTSPVLD
jgi:hypothetical protein